MQRMITAEIGGRFRVGDILDYPRETWTGIAKSVKKKLDKFSAPLSEIGEGIAKAAARKKK